MNWRPQILVAALGLVVIGVTTLFVAPEYIEIVVPSVITGLAALGMKLAES